MKGYGRVRGLSVIRHAIVPQVLPLFMGYNFYMLDHNIRVALAIGIVGAGGLGVDLFTQMEAFHYQKAAAILLLIFVIITIIDRASSRLRKSIIQGGFLQPGTRRQDALLLVVIGLLAFVSIYFFPLDFKEMAAGAPACLGIFERHVSSRFFQDSGLPETNAKDRGHGG